MNMIGYEFLKDQLGLQVFPIQRPAQVRSVTKIQELGDILAIPAAIAPRSSDPLEHLLFALKHEGTELSLIAACMPHIPGERMLQALTQTPNGIYTRKAAYFWEWFRGESLIGAPIAGGVIADVFDPRQYLVGDVTDKSTRWRVNFNGLGSREFCPTVRKTKAIQQLMSENIMGQVRSFMASMDEAMLDRALSWAYLDETKSSYAIEQEIPSGAKTETFMRLLKLAHDREPLTEAYLVQLQNAAISNPMLRAMAFRHEQNFLRNSSPGVLGVTYLPPAPKDLMRVMNGVMALNNPAHQATMEPLLRAGLVSFGFVFAHPFMDGNGRLSRFLIHQTLCRSQALKDGQILPISIAMKRHEKDYLNALKSFSRPARGLWSATWIDGDSFEFEFKGHESVYRFWDATPCIEFTYRMAKEALEKDLAQEVKFLEGYDRMVQTVNDNFDVVGSDLSMLILVCYQNNGRLSTNQRRKFKHRVSDEILDFIEKKAIEEFGNFSAQ